METINFSKFRQNLTEYLTLTKYRHERLVVTRNGKVMGAFVPIEDLDMLEAMEDQADIRDAEAALKRGQFEDWEEVKKEMKQHYEVSDQD